MRTEFDRQKIALAITVQYITVQYITGGKLVIEQR